MPLRLAVALSSQASGPRPLGPRVELYVVVLSSAVVPVFLFDFKLLVLLDTVMFGGLMFVGVFYCFLELIGGHPFLGRVPWTCECQVSKACMISKPENTSRGINNFQ